MLSNSHSNKDCNNFIFLLSDKHSNQLSEPTYALNAANSDHFANSNNHSFARKFAFIFYYGLASADNVDLARKRSRCRVCFRYKLLRNAGNTANFSLGKRFRFVYVNTKLSCKRELQCNFYAVRLRLRYVHGHRNRNVNINSDALGSAERKRWRAALCLGVAGRACLCGGGLSTLRARATQ